MARFSSLARTWRRPAPTRIFISYRRNDAAGYAGRMYDGLSTHFGRSNVFIDVDAIAPGLDYHRRIDDVLSSCTVVLVLIGPKWATASLADGTPRLSDPADLVRHEIVSALQRSITVMPVLVQNASMADEAALPEPLRPLARRHAFELSDSRWNYDLRRLISALEDAAAPPSRRAQLRLLRPATVLPVAVVLLAIVTSILAWNAARRNGATRTEGNASRLIFSDSLSAPLGRWPTSSGGGCIEYFSDGAYRFQVHGQNKFCAEDTDFDSRLASLRNVRVEVTAVWTKLPNRNLGKFGAGGIALRCRAAGDIQSGSSYSATFSPTGYYELVRFNSGKQTNLATGTISTLVTQLGTERRLRLDCLEQGDGSIDLRFYVDDRLIRSFAERSGLPAGAVGIEVDSFHAEPVEAEFRQLRIYGS